MAKSQANSSNPKRRRGPGRIRRWVTLVVILASIVAALPTAIVVAVGMLPTLVSFIIDMTPGRYACRCVAGLNVAGVAPFVDKLWGGHNDVGAAINIIGDTLAWLAFYGSAGFGWVLFMSLPGVVATSRTLNAQRMVHNLRAKQEELAQEWDLAVKGRPTDGKPSDADTDADADADDDDDSAFDSIEAAH